MHSFHVHYVPTMCHKLCKELGKLVTKGTFCNQKLTFQLQTQSHSNHPVKGTECQHACILLTFLMKYHHAKGEWKVSRLVGRRNKRLMRWASKHHIIPRAFVTSSSCKMRFGSGSEIQWHMFLSSAAGCESACFSQVKYKLKYLLPPCRKRCNMLAWGAEITIGGECIIADTLSSE